ncbi:bifunctional folylpolyglutamate synthase/dihydrofolate synthase [Patescibacteria group bacterium]|nr:bifunctional folylpolyglutamate synthase/dihydrofolate synthase [Patescibacteria group bacterium]MBU1673721.1 bifunctional folylpolyglutamate synthase/dihydrofolate synthase [Patescibacteria group bacterium]MBU1963049.1 bifunctional folylpolyglutamate synthase/dihydrofolate synthase [Patescibacteria group bacterium]
MPARPLPRKLSNWLSSLDANRTDHYSTDRIKEFLSSLGNPQDQFHSVHIAGTSGKGSTSTMLAKILEEAGYKTGLITSPYLVSPFEKIKINSRNISSHSFESLVKEYKQEIKKYKLTYFEVWIALAFIYFAKQKIDWAVVETGLGGRFDATNVLKSDMVIITTIDYDHTDILGTTLPQIAREKQAIIKTSSIALSGSKLIKNAKYINTSDYRLLTTDLQITSFNYKSLKNVQLSLLGEFQIKNAILAIEAAKILKIPEKNIYSGLIKAKHPGRFEIISRRPLIIMDGAHSPEKMKAFSSSLKKIVLEKKDFKNKYLLFSLKYNKDYKKVIDNIVPLFDNIILTGFEKSIDLKTLKKYIGNNYPNKNVIIIDDAIKSYKAIKRKLKLNDLLVITGSLYMIGDLKKGLNM